MFVSCECCQTEVSASRWSLIQRSPAECGVSECDREAPIMGRSWPTGGLLRHWNGSTMTAYNAELWQQKLWNQAVILFCWVADTEMQRVVYSTDSVDRDGITRTLHKIRQSVSYEPSLYVSTFRRAYRRHYHSVKLSGTSRRCRRQLTLTTALGTSTWTTWPLKVKTPLWFQTSSPLTLRHSVVSWEPNSCKYILFAFKCKLHRWHRHLYSFRPSPLAAVPSYLWRPAPTALHCVICQPSSTCRKAFVWNIDLKLPTHCSCSFTFCVQITAVLFLFLATPYCLFHNVSVTSRQVIAVTLRKVLRQQNRYFCRYLAYFQSFRGYDEHLKKLSYRNRWI
jgi:hypothetical protein